MKEKVEFYALLWKLLSDVYVKIWMGMWVHSQIYFWSVFIIFLLFYLDTIYWCGFIDGKSR